MKRSRLPRSTKPLKRTPLPRGSGLKRTGRVNPINRTRRASELVRAYGPAERREWVKSLPSVVSGRRPCVNAHVGTGGTGRKADARFIVPLTWEEHEEAHRIGERAFEAKHGISLSAEAAETERRWLAFSSNP